MMRVALDAARKALASSDIPVGAAIFNKAGDLIATGHNERELHNDPTAHAEIVAIRTAAEKIGDWHLTDHTLVVTLEPCAMCAGAIAQSRLQTVVFGAWDETGGVSLHFLGRREIAGLEVGSQLRAEGMVGEEEGSMVILNPSYELLV